MSLTRRVLFCLYFALVSNALVGQYKHVPVFEQLENQPLLDSMVARYKSFFLLPYSTCRDTLFAKIDAVHDSLECIYTGMKRYIPPGTDPTDAVLLNGQPNGINTEHVYPQSKGADGYGRSDMHILFPSRVRTNSNRLNNPFGEIPDNEAALWYFLTFEITTPPTSNRNAYSESTPVKFEPRESVKGNIARAMFYFYTLYNTDALNADPVFFNLQKTELCNWHFNDPVDSVEWARNLKIQQYQKNLNPFILDCSVASRTYCPTISDACRQLTHTSEIKNISFEIYLFPNPGGNVFTIGHSYNPRDYIIRIADCQGRSVDTSLREIEDGLVEISLPTGPAGVYYLHIFSLKTGQKSAMKYLRLP